MSVMYFPITVKIRIGNWICDILLLQLLFCLPQYAILHFMSAFVAFIYLETALSPKTPKSTELQQKKKVSFGNNHLFS